LDRAVAHAHGRFAATAHHNRGTLRQAAGDLAGALADFDRALELDPEHLATYVARGTARKEAGDLAGALLDCDRALAALPREAAAPVYHLRGGVRVLLNQFAEAIADYNEALRLDPGLLVAYLSRGHARYHQRDPRGLADYRTAFRLDPEGAAHELLRLLAEDARRDAAGVLDNCARHLRLNERDALAHARRGLTLLLLAREAEATANLSRFAELAPDSLDCLRRLMDLARRCRVG
jgi:tetratricopeptide (TPR) repeat protein